MADVSGAAAMSADKEKRSAGAAKRQVVRIFLCGDVMTGRGIDQVLPHPCDPLLHESYVTSAADYVRIAEEASGPIPKNVEFSYIWGIALQELERMRPDVRIVNLETSITRSDAYVRKGINYRMSPENADCLPAASIDCCVLANNHLLDWGRPGLLDTLATLERLRIKPSGAGRDFAAATAPAALQLAEGGRVLVFSFASVTSGVPESWAATDKTSGVSLLADLSEASVARIAERIERARRPGDIVIVSIHWGPNWGYEIPAQQRRFAHALLDKAAVSILHGHSSHHPKGMEVYRNRLILYGCGDFIDDYEGIEGYEDFRDDLVLMYFADIARASGKLVSLDMVPLQIKRFQLARASPADAAWLVQRLDRESCKLGVGIELAPTGHLALSRPSGPAVINSCLQ
jgi:poly-gamma-glutamate synthesis protein (capsule biosynthesis protein)